MCNSVVNATFEKGKHVMLMKEKSKDMLCRESVDVSQLERADRATLKWRRDLKKLGVSVVFRSGLTREETLRILKSDK